MNALPLIERLAMLSVSKAAYFVAWSAVWLLVTSSWLLCVGSPKGHDSLPGTPTELEWMKMRHQWFEKFADGRYSAI